MAGASDEEENQEEGIEVAWNRVRVRTLAERDPAMVDRLHAEVRLLRSLSHDHIIGFHKVWLDLDHGVINFITEVCNSGRLLDYRDRHKRVCSYCFSRYLMPLGICLRSKGIHFRSTRWLISLVPYSLMLMGYLTEHLVS